MECIPTNPLLELRSDAVEYIRKLYNIDRPERLKETLDLLEDWVQKQTHFVKQDFSRDYLEKSYIARKGSVEKAKKLMDRICTMKTLLPKFFEKTNVREELQYISELAWLLPLPMTTVDYYRVFLVRITDKEFQPRHFMEFYQYCIILGEYIKKHDYVNGVVIVFDFRRINIIELVTKLNPVELQQIVVILTEAYDARLRNVYLISESKAIELLVNTAKKFLSPKIGSKIHVVVNTEDLHKYVPKDILPTDYGGNEKSTDVLIGAWIDALSTKEHVEYMKMMNKACTNESLRQSGKFNEDCIGMPGSFRNLSVD